MASYDIEKNVRQVVTVGGDNIPRMYSPTLRHTYLSNEYAGCSIEIFDKDLNENCYNLGDFSFLNEDPNEPKGPIFNIEEVDIEADHLNFILGEGEYEKEYELYETIDGKFVVADLDWENKTQLFEHLVDALRFIFGSKEIEEEKEHSFNLDYGYVTETCLKSAKEHKLVRRYVFAKEHKLVQRYVSAK